MSLDNSPWSPAEAAELQWSAAGEPRSSRFEDCYFSRDDGLAVSLRKAVTIAGPACTKRAHALLDRLTVLDRSYEGRRDTILQRARLLLTSSEPNVIDAVRLGAQFSEAFDDLYPDASAALFKSFGTTVREADRPALDALRRAERTAVAIVTAGRG